MSERYEREEQNVPAKAVGKGIPTREEQDDAGLSRSSAAGTSHPAQVLYYVTTALVINVAVQSDLSLNGGNCH